MLLVTLGLVVVVLLMSYALVAWWGAEGVVRRRPPDPPTTPADCGLPFTEAAFPARDGTPLHGYWIPPPDTTASAGPAPAIIICSGYNGSLDADVPHAPALHRAGFGVLLFDFRGHGRSGGDCVSLGYHERGDVLGAVDWLVAQDVTRVGLLGFSMGGATAISAAPDHPAVAAVVADGAYAEVKTVIAGGLRERYKTGALTSLLTWGILQAAGWRVGADLPRAEPLRHVARLAPRALLLIHGANDTYVPLDSVRRLYRAAHAPKALWVVPEAGHRAAYPARPQEYERRVVAFFWQHLA